jgi:hypothetical protein
MTYRLRLSDIVPFNQGEHSVAVGVEFDRYAAIEFSLYLSMLRQGLVDELRIGTKSTPIILLITLSNNKKQRGATVTWDGDIASIKVPLVEIERWLQFFLVYVRDETFPVDHIDVECKDTSRESDKTLDIVFAVDRSYYNNLEEAIRRVPR